jgi:hypothetical protein
MEYLEMKNPQFPDTVQRRLGKELYNQQAPLGFVKGQAPDYSQFETADTLAQEAEIKAILNPARLYGGLF